MAAFEDRASCLLSHIGGWAMLQDQILDAMTAKQYYDGCLDGSVECTYWFQATLFMCLPTILATIWFTRLAYQGSKWDIFNVLIYGLMYPITVPLAIIGRTCTMQSWREEHEVLSFWKFFEIIGEAIPQVIVYWEYFANYGTYHSITSLFSNIHSMIMLFISLFKLARAWRHMCKEQLPNHV